MSKIHLNTNIFLFCAIVASLMILGNAGSAKVIWPEDSPTLTGISSPTKIGGAFRLAGDRSGTIWLSVEGTSRSFPPGPSTEQIAFNQDAILGTVEFLTSDDVKPTPAITQETTASFVSRKAALTTDHKTSVIVPWPFLLLSALVGLGLWANQKRGSA